MGKEQDWFPLVLRAVSSELGPESELQLFSLHLSLCSTHSSFCRTNNHFCSTHISFCSTNNSFCSTNNSFCSTNNSFSAHKTCIKAHSKNNNRDNIQNGVHSHTQCLTLHTKSTMSKILIEKARVRVDNAHSSISRSAFITWHSPFLLVENHTSFQYMKHCIVKGTTDPRHWVLWLIKHLLVQRRTFNKLWNFGPTSAWLCLAKGETYIAQLWPIHVTTLTNPCSNIDKSLYQFWKIHVTIQRNPCNNFDKSNLNKIQPGPWVSDFILTILARQWIVGPIKISKGEYLGLLSIYDAF